MYDNDINKIESDVEKFTKKIQSINLKDDVYQLKSEIERLDQMSNDLNDRLEETTNELSESDSNKSPLLGKLSQIKTDFEIALNKFKTIKKSWKFQYDKENYRQGEITGYEKKKIERDIIMETHKETDFQGDIINSIGKHIKNTNEDFGEINSELKDQGEQINNIHEKTNNMTGQVINIDKVMTQIERRRVCAKVIGIIGIIVVALADISLLVVKLVKR